MGEKQVSARFLSDSKKIEIDINSFSIIADGGDKTDPSPGNLFLAGVVACTASTARGYCLHHNLPLPTGLTAVVSTDEETNLINRVQMKLSVPPEFPPERLEALERAAGRCTVKNWWNNPPEFSLETSQS